MELEERYQACPFCGISCTNFEFHLNVHEDCRLMDDQSKQLGKKREEMKGLKEALNFIDSRLLQHSDEEAEEDVGEQFGHYDEVAPEKNAIKDELEIGETEFLEQGLVSDEDGPDLTDPLDDTAESKLKTEMQTDVKMLARGATGVVGGRSKKQFCIGEQPSEIFCDQPTGSKVETVEDAPQGSSLAKLKFSDAGRFEVKKFNSGKMSSWDEVWKEEVEERKEPDKRKTLFLTTASQSSGKSRTFRLMVRPECNFGKVRSNVAEVLKVDPERIVLTRKGRNRRIDDSTLVEQIQDCKITACIL